MVVTTKISNTPSTTSATISNNPQAVIARSCKLPTPIRPWKLRFDVKYFYEERITNSILKTMRYWIQFYSNIMSLQFDNCSDAVIISFLNVLNPKT